MMKKCSKSLIIIALLVVMGSAAIGQESLKEIVTGEGFAWLAGRWKATTDEGQEILLGYRWAANGHAVVSDFKMGEDSRQGIIYYVADEEIVKQLTVDSKGKVTISTWEVDGNRIVTKTKMSDEYGQETAVAIAYSKIDNKTMKVKLFGLESGQVAEEAWFELEFKRQARPAAGAAARKKRAADANKARKRKVNE